MEFLDFLPDSLFCRMNRFVTDGIGRCGVANRDAAIGEGLEIRLEISGLRFCV